VNGGNHEGWHVESELDEGVSSTYERIQAAPSRAKSIALKVLKRIPAHATADSTGPSSRKSHRGPKISLGDVYRRLHLAPSFAATAFAHSLDWAGRHKGKLTSNIPGSRHHVEAHSSGSPGPGHSRLHPRPEHESPEPHDESKITMDQASPTADRELASSEHHAIQNALHRVTLRASRPGDWFSTATRTQHDVGGDLLLRDALVETSSEEEWFDAFEVWWENEGLNLAEESTHSRYRNAGGGDNDRLDASNASQPFASSPSDYSTSSNESANSSQGMEPSSMQEIDGWTLVPG